MTDIFWIALTTFIATVGPLDVAVIYAALGEQMSPAAKRRMALRGVLLAGAILFAFALAGEALLRGMGISQAAFRAAGGVLLLLMGVDMVFARESGGISATVAEKRDAETRADISVFPLAMPLIAGPGTIGAVILLGAGGELADRAAVLAALGLVLVLTFAAMLLAEKLHKLLGVAGRQMIIRVFGFLLAALAMQFIFDGIFESRIFQSRILSE